jgi:hypothetical protein
MSAGVWPDPNKGAVRVNERELTDPPWLGLDGRESWNPSRREAELGEFGMQCVHILHAPIALGVAGVWRQVSKGKEVHLEVAAGENGIATKLLRPPTDRAKAEALEEGTGLCEVPGGQDGRGGIGTQVTTPLNPGVRDAAV